ncbi:MAG TPA: pyrroloquinoline quinone biosynthesis peptide chaperone PqqD [Candidatus Binatia bacterium]|nr:pyrroloquinoline quinone biosynthesis peptide chaperone PqqD [Candidatus Binatia bacterium]
MISATTRPRLAAKARLRWDRKGERYMLLYPERGLVLNPTAADVVRLCTGEHTVEVIVERLAAKYTSQPREALGQEILTFLGRLAERGLVSDGGA